MYSVVMMAALTSGADTADFSLRNAAAINAVTAPAAVPAAS
jgi:hypothetical protein